MLMNSHAMNFSARLFNYCGISRGFLLTPRASPETLVSRFLHRTRTRRVSRAVEVGLGRLDELGPALSRLVEVTGKVDHDDDRHCLPRLTLFLELGPSLGMQWSYAEISANSGSIHEVIPQSHFRFRWWKR